MLRPSRRLLLLLTAGLAPLAVPAAAPAPDTMAERARACTACHGAQDRQTAEGYVPRIAGKPAGYLLEQLRNFRDGRRRQETMARLLENLDERYLDELAHYFADQAPPRHAPVAADPAAAAGAAWVRQGDAGREVPPCTACHGGALTGVAPNVPGLLGLPAAYLSAQLGAWRQGLRQAREPDCMARVARALPAEAIPAITRWLEAQPLPVPATPAASAPGPWPLACGSIAR